jgi:pimeloyl-ACP methyl ester carboxylesterase
MSSDHRVVFLPGGVLPAAPAYGALLEVLGARVDAIAKDLEVYSGDQPPADYSLDVEVQGVLREADSRGFHRFHLVGYSGGGASSLAFAAQHGDRLLSLALLEPAWAGNARTGEEEALWVRFRALKLLPPDEFMAGFVRLQLAPGVEPPSPPAGPPPPWMAKRPAWVRALIDPFDNGDLKSGRLAGVGPARVLCTRWSQQSGLLRPHGHPVGLDLPQLHGRDVPRTPPLRPSTQGRARASGGIAFWQRAEA